MPNNPFDIFKRFAKEQFERDKKLIEFSYSQTDGFITWIIGFAVAALSLIISDIEKLQKSFSVALKPLIVLLMLTICFGLAYRYFSYRIVILHKRLEDYFAGVFSDLEIEPIEADEEIENATFDEIILLLKKDFNEVISYPVALSDELKEIELPNLKKHYKALCAHSRKKFDVVAEYWADIYETAYRSSKDKFLNSLDQHIKNKPRIGFNVKLWHLLTGFLYLLCLLSFMCAVIVACYHLITLSSNSIK
jgi:hypothetical protein